MTYPDNSQQEKVIYAFPITKEMVAKDIREFDKAKEFEDFLAALESQCQKEVSQNA